MHVLGVGLPEVVATGLVVLLMFAVRVADEMERRVESLPRRL